MKTVYDFRDLKIISYYIGVIIIGTAILMIFPILTSLAFREEPIFFDFIISMCISILFGLLLINFGNKSIKEKGVQWKHGVVIASFSWIILMVLCAVPYKLSGFYNSMIDACFDVISGFTTTGIILIQNLDHAPNGLNMWRHIITFVGGQGMVVLALSLLVKDTVGAYKMYVGEAKDIEIAPNVKGTAKIIWGISMIYLVIGTIVLWINGIVIGLKPVSAFFHGLYIFMSSWSTGGFAPMSQNINYYHSLSYEIVTIILFIIGSLNFGLHYSLWKGNKKEIIKNIETQSFFITATLGSFFTVIALSKTGIYKDAISIFRRGIYNLLSAHTTTGFANIFMRQFATDFGDFGLMILVIVMIIGGSACSTAGGIKGLRIGIIFKSIINEVKKLLSHERKVNVFKFHYMKDLILEDNLIKISALIAICYIVIFLIGTMLGVYYGYPLIHSAFEAASASGNVGLSIGVVSTTMPTLMKVYYIIAMWLGRLEFLSAFALIGFLIGGTKRICGKTLAH